MEEQQVMLGGDRFADALNVTAGLGADITETIEVQAIDLDVPAHAGFFIKGIKAVTTFLGSGWSQQFDVTHLRQRLHPRDAVAAMDPVVIAFDSDAGDVGVFEGLQYINGFSKSSRQNLADVEEVTAGEDEIDHCFNSVSHYTSEATEEVLVAFRFTSGGAVGFTEMDVRSLDEAHKLPAWFDV